MTEYEHFIRDLRAGSIETDDDDEVRFDDSARVVVTDGPWEDFFDTSEFYQLDTTVARPIKQKYNVNGDMKTFKKPRGELQKAAWSLDNTPWTLGHPSTGLVKQVDDIRGFFKGPFYDEENDDLKAKLHIPVDDEEAQEFAEENTDLSVGFRTKYDDAPEEDVDAYQVDMYFNHVASVELGRCSGEDGCGIDDLNDSTSVVAADSGLTEGDSIDMPFGEATVVDVLDDGLYSFDVEETIQDAGLYEDENGDVFGVSPSESTDGDRPKFPMANCSDVADAWGLRGQGNHNVTKSTLGNRIIRRAKDLGCDQNGLPDTMVEEMENGNNDDGNESDNDSSDMTDGDYDIDPKMTDDSDTQTDCGCGGGDADSSTDGSIDIGVDSLTLDALAARNDDVAELVEDKHDLEETVDEYEDEIDELRSEVDEYREQEKQSLVADITSITDRWDEEDLMELDIDDLEDRKGLAQDIMEDVDKDTATANPDKDDDGVETDRHGPRVRGEFIRDSDDYERVVGQ